MHSSSVHVSTTSPSVTSCSPKSEYAPSLDGTKPAWCCIFPEQLWLLLSSNPAWTWTLGAELVVIAPQPKSVSDWLILEQGMWISSCDTRWNDAELTTGAGPHMSISDADGSRVISDLSIPGNWDKKKAYKTYRSECFWPRDREATLKWWLTCE